MTCNLLDVGVDGMPVNVAVALGVWGPGTGTFDVAVDGTVAGASVW